MDPSNETARRELDELRRQLEHQPAPEPLPQKAAETSQSADTPPKEGQPDLPGAQPLPAGIRLDVTDEMREAWDRAAAAGEPLFCIDHPHRETVLRCNRCAAPVCPDCVVRTPVGFRCKECIKAQQSGFYNARGYDWIIAAVLSFALSIPAAILSSLLGWWFALIVSGMTSEVPRLLEALK